RSMRLTSFFFASALSLAAFLHAHPSRAQEATEAEPPEKPDPRGPRNSVPAFATGIVIDAVGGTTLFSGLMAVFFSRVGDAEYVQCEAAAPRGKRDHCRPGP